jgi:phosphoserine phosphatase/lysophospholipase L1-like esterase
MSTHDEHDAHDHAAHQSHRDPRDPRAASARGAAGREERDSIETEAGPAITWPVAALAALTAAVIWFGVAPAPATRPTKPTAATRPQEGVGPATPTTAARPGSAPAVKVDPLPSWNEGPTKQAILDFVEKVTRKGSDTFVPVPERVAVFDHDGTLVCEKPIVHGMFFVDRLRALAERQPEIAHEEPYASLLSGDIEFVRRLGKKYLTDLIFTTLSGVPEEQLEAETRQFLVAARHPVFDVPYGDVTYQPMKELMALLRSHDFAVWICSGSGVHFMRPAAEAWYGIGPERVIASRPATEMREVAAAPEGDDDVSPNRRLGLVVLPQLEVLNDEERKPVSIGEQIGRRPIFAAGNVGTTGDIEMLRWSQSGGRHSLQLLVLHDDATREMAYGEASNDSLEAAEKYGWSVVRMAQDWNRVFATPLEKKQVSPPNPAPPATSGPVAVTSATSSQIAVTPAAVPVPSAGRWEEEIAAIERADREDPPAPGGVVFLGSSNVRLWTTLDEDFTGLNPLRRGVGGARLSELAPQVSRLAVVSRPAAVVVSAGGNDIAAGASPEEVRDAFVAVVNTLRRELPDVRIAFASIGPSTKRWSQWEQQQQANGLIRDFIAAQGAESGMTYIDIAPAFLTADGTPAVEAFVDDQLHPSTIGNARRAAIIRPRLEALLAGVTRETSPEQREEAPVR